jgi:hypothetical protein
MLFFKEVESLVDYNVALLFQFKQKPVIFLPPVPADEFPCLKVNKNENFLASILNFVLFHCYLCQNIKILQKKLLDWASIGGGTIFPRSPRTTGNEKKF